LLPSSSHSRNARRGPISGRTAIDVFVAEIDKSLHTYGRHINYTGRSEFDPEHKCERPYVIKVADEHALA
jgi:hypothetical protein